jgi:hypothetical protein
LTIPALDRETVTCKDSEAEGAVGEMLWSGTAEVEEPPD